MKQFKMILLLTILCAFTAAVMAQIKLGNKDIIEMQKAGMSESIILAKIDNSPGEYDTSTKSLQKLKSAGVSEKIILAMVNKDAATPAVSTTTNEKTATQNPMLLPSSPLFSPSSPLLGGGAFSSAGAAMVIVDGTEIKVQTDSEISGNKVSENDALIFKVSDDIKINGRTVVAKGATAKGIVVGASKSGMMGKGGTLNVRVEYVETVDGQKLKLRSSKSGEGGNNMGSTIALTVLFGPIGLLKHGKEAKIKPGTVLTTYADENKAVLPKE